MHSFSLDYKKENGQIINCGWGSGGKIGDNRYHNYNDFKNKYKLISNLEVEFNNIVNNIKKELKDFDIFDVMDYNLIMCNFKLNAKEEIDKISIKFILKETESLIEVFFDEKLNYIKIADYYKHNDKMNFF